jgi:hypothetical protein
MALFVRLADGGEDRYDPYVVCGLCRRAFDDVGCQSSGDGNWHGNYKVKLDASAQASADGGLTVIHPNGTAIGGYPAGGWVSWQVG